MKWSKVQKRLYEIMVPDMNLQLHCTTYPVRNGRKGKGNKEGLPRYWFTLDKEIIWDWPKDFMHDKKLQWEQFHGYGFNKEEEKWEKYAEGRTHHCTVIGRILRDYLDSSKNGLRDKEFKYDHFGFTDILKVADKRIGRRSLSNDFLFKIHPVAKKLAEHRLGTRIMNYHPQVQIWLDEFKELFPDRKILFLYKAGSHFFDLNTPDSDLDYRGVYLPAPEEFKKKRNGKKENRRKQFERKTNDKKHTKNSNDDIDFLLFSYTKVLELLRSGDFNVMEMLYCPDDKILIDSPMMKELRDFRRNLMVVDPSSFLGFIGKEYRRYGININHYGAQERFLKFLRKLASEQEKGTSTKMKDVWNDIKEYAKDDPMISFTTSKTGNSVYVPTLKLAQTLHQWTVKIGYVIDALDQKLTTYGHRQKNMAESGREYKGLYHALRLIYEATDLMDMGELELPFSEKRLNTLMAIKTGRMEQEKVHELIDAGIDSLKMRENLEDGRIKTSKRAIEHRINKMINTYTGRMELSSIGGVNG